MEVSEVINGFRKSLENKVSEVTVKNYISDINHFIEWTANNSSTPICADSISKSTFLTYIEGQSAISSSELSRKSFKRHLSSLRAFSKYLQNNGILTDDPFEKVEIPTSSDTWKLSEFKNYLQEKKAGPLTIKYYINDVQCYARWCKETRLDVAFHEKGIPSLNDDLVMEYAKRLQFVKHLSPKSINRQLSSLRSYSAFRKVYLGNTGDIEIQEVQNIPLLPTESLAISQIEVSTPNTAYSKFPPLRLLQRLTRPYVNAEDRIASTISSHIIKTRLTKLLKESKKTPQTAFESMIRGIRTKNIPKEFYAPGELSLSQLPLHKKALHHIKYTRPKWYKTYHNYAFVHYVHFGVLAIFTILAASYLYGNTLGSARANNSSFSALSQTQKTYSFQGRLMDKNGNPVTRPTDIRLLLYNDPAASGSSLLWQEVQKDITPNQDGYVNLLIGGSEAIPSELTTSSDPLYLGVSVGATEELVPRKQLGEAYAKDSGKLFGMLPITRSSKQTNVVLALDGQGNLNIGGNSDHAFRASGGDFILSGETLILATNPGASGNVVLAPYGNGKIDLQKALISTSGLIQAEGTFEIHATTSASPALSLKQDSSGDLLSASTAGSTKFVINNQGVITRGSWAGEVIGTEFGGFGANISATGPGELLYSTGSRSYGSLKAGKSGDCLLSSGRSAPVWSACTILSTLNGVASLSNNSLDIAFGGNSTESAKFAFINISQSNPIFKIGGNLSISSENGIENHDKDLKIGGNTTKNIIVNTNGNLGIKNSNPTRTLDVNGSWGGNVDFYVDGANNSTITRDTPALTYDLEKNTGTTDTSTTTTYNIVGIPEINGTVAFIYAKVEKAATANPQTQTIAIQIHGSQISTLSTNDGIGSTGQETSIKHFTVSRSNNTWHLVGNSGSTDNADLAEWTEHEGTTPLDGSIVSISSTGKIQITDTEYDKRMAGIISTKPNITIGNKTPSSSRLALSGRVPTIITSINGDVLAGDPITSSIIPGAGMKLSRNGPIVGKALESFKSNEQCVETPSLNEIRWPHDDGKNTTKPCFKIKISNLSSEIQHILSTNYGYSYVDYLYIGKIMVFTNLSWSESTDILASLDALSIETVTPAPINDGSLSLLMQNLQDTYPAVKIGGKLIENIDVFSELAVGKLKAGSIIASNIGTNNLAAATALIGNLTTTTLNVTDSLFINGISLKDYIAQEFQNQEEIRSPLAYIETIQTNTIRPQGNNLSVELPNASDSAIVVTNQETHEDVITFSAQGNITARSGSISGELATDSLSAQSATISGTLHADRLVAGEIAGLDDRLTTIATSLIKQSKPENNTHSQLLDDSITHASVSAGFGTFYNGLLSLGASTFGDISAMNSLSVGTTLTISPNSIDTLGMDLEIQPLRQGNISFMAGAVRINIDGTLAVFEDALFQKSLTVKGNLSAQIVSPLPGSDLSVQLPESATNSGRFSITDSSQSPVFVVNSSGNVASSGSATFSKINFNIVGQAVASGQYEATATGSAGTAILKKNTNELTIINPLVTQNSLIYITPAQETQNKVLYLMRQSAESNNTQGSFTVGLSGLATQDMLFNWLIVN